MEYLTDEMNLVLAEETKGFLIGSGELLRMAKRDQSLQISIPDDLQRHVYQPSLVSFRGAVRLATVWANEMMQRD